SPASASTSYRMNESATPFSALAIASSIDYIQKEKFSTARNAHSRKFITLHDSPQRKQHSRHWAPAGPPVLNGKMLRWCGCPQGNPNSIYTATRWHMPQPPEHNGSTSR